MAITQIQVTGRKQGPTTFEKVLGGIELATKILGTAIEVPLSLQKYRLGKLEGEKTKAETEVLKSEAAPLSGEEAQALRQAGVPGSALASRKRALSFYEKIYETPAMKLSREKTDAALAIAARAEERAQEKERREEAKFTREIKTPVLTPGEQEADKKFADEYQNWNAQGGYGQASKNLAQARWAMARLLQAQKENKNYSGRDVGITTGRAKAFAFPEAADMEDKVRQIVVTNLRQALGPQFTEREGERIMSQTFNPMLDEKENASRLDGLIKQLEAVYEAKESASQYWRKNGTIKGWQGNVKLSAPPPTKNDAENF